jgi:LysR family glycine cleavage system transcriptional activator
MTYRIPPLNALRAFESAARHLSFKHAGAELNVTPGAVSQQEKSLEDVLRVRLFDRIHNGLLLTAEGSQYLAPIRSAFTSITIATELIAPRAEGADLTIGADAVLAIKWLVPQVAAFQRVHPDLRLRIGEVASADSVIDGDVDIAILKGVSAYGGLRCDPVFQEDRFPMAAPALLDNGPIDLAQTILLVADDRAIWTTWLQQAKAPGLAELNRVDMAERGLAIHAAIAGRGLAMGSTLEEAAELAEGWLAPAVARIMVSGPTYYAVYPTGRASCPAEAAFLDWLRTGLPDQPAAIPAS